MSDKLLYALIDAESGWNTYARSKISSAKGLLQFVDGTFAKYCYGDVFNPAHSLECAARMISQGGITHWLASPETAAKIRPLLSSL